MRGEGQGGLHTHEGTIKWDAVLVCRKKIVKKESGIPVIEQCSFDEAIQEAVADGRGIRQQVREQMLRTEREWVVNVPEKDIELEKTLGGD